MTTSSTQTAQPQTLTMESDLSYTPPPAANPAEQAEFDQSLKDVISEIEGEWAGGRETPDETPAEVKPDEPAVEPEKATAEVAKDPAEERGFDRLVQREVALQARESAFQAREARVQSLESELASLRKAVPSKDLQEKFAYSPSEAVKALGHDPETVVRLLLAETLQARGEKVPEALKKFVGEAATTRRIRALEEQLAQKNQAEAASQEFNALQLGGLEYVKTVDSGQEWKQMPTLAKAAKSAGDRVHRAIMEEILADAQRRVSADPAGQPMTYAQAARNVEARWADMRAFFSSLDNPGAGGPSTTAATTQSTKPNTGTGNTPPQPKPPAKPIAPWQKPKNLESQGIDEAIREFNRLEAEARSRR